MNAVTVQLGFIPPAVAWKQCIRQQGNNNDNKLSRFTNNGINLCLIISYTRLKSYHLTPTSVFASSFSRFEFFCTNSCRFLLLVGLAEHVTDRNAKQNKSLSRLPLYRTSLWGRCIAVHVKDKGNACKITDFLLEIKLAFREEPGRNREAN